MTNCNIIRDLLPLYVDDACSEETKAMIAEHLTSCESCRKEYEDLKAHEDIEFFPEIDIDEGKAIKSFAHKIRIKSILKIIISIIATIITIFMLAFVLYVPSFPAKYKDGMISVDTSSDTTRIDIHLRNYKTAYAVYYLNDDGTYDLYITIEKNLWSTIVPDTNKESKYIFINDDICASVKFGTYEIDFRTPTDYHLGHIYYVENKYESISGLDNKLISTDIDATQVY